MKKFVKSVVSLGIKFYRGLVDYVFRSFIMYIPFHCIRLFFIRRKLYAMGSDVTFLIGTEIRTGTNISVGSNTIINQKVLLDGRGGKLIIGNNVDIAQETNIWTLEHDVHSDIHHSKGGDVIIEDYVWIASRVTILPGVKIGRGAVIASNALVSRDVEPMTIVGGIPAKVIGIRKSNLTYSLRYRPFFR